MGGKTIPDKWRDYRQCGVPIRNERIIAFKTPLSRKFDNESPLDNGIMAYERFTPNDVLEEMRRQRKRLGMVVDFTNTLRYYNGREFQEHGIHYEKLKCVGKEIPSELIVNRFKSVVQHFFEGDQTDSLVGVHCTHGLNRAGYIVCRFLIDCQGYQPHDAIAAFNVARGHVMERENYLEDLRQRRPNKVRRGPSRLPRNDFSDRNFVRPPGRNCVPVETSYDRNYTWGERNGHRRMEHQAGYSTNYGEIYQPYNNRRDTSFGRSSQNHTEHSRHVSKYAPDRRESHRHGNHPRDSRHGYRHCPYGDSRTRRSSGQRRGDGRNPYNGPR